MAAEGNRTEMSRWLRLLRHTEDACLALLLGGMVLLAASQILLRNVFEVGLFWADPLLRALVLWVGLLGALVASREDRHISIDVLSRFLAGRPARWARVVTSFFTAVVSGVLAYHAARFVASDYGAGVEAFAGVPAWAVESILPFAFGVVSLRYLLLFGAAFRDATSEAGR